MHMFVVNHVPKAQRAKKDAKQDRSGKEKRGTLVEFPANTPSYNGTRLIATFQLIQLTQQMRCASDPVHAARLERFRDPTILCPITAELVSELRVISRADYEADPTWLDALFVVATNIKRHHFNELLAPLVCLRLGVPIVRWRLPITGALVKGLSADHLDQLYMQNRAVLWGTFAEGMRGFLTTNVATLLGCANSTEVYYHSLTFDNEAPASVQASITQAKQRISAAAAGQTVDIDVVPYSVNVSVPSAFESNVFPAELSLAPGAVVIPTLANRLFKREVQVYAVFDDGTTLFGDVNVVSHCTEAGLCVTLHRVQGKTTARMCADLCKRSTAPHLTAAAALVALSRCKNFAHFRVLPPPSGQNFDHLTAIQRDPDLHCFMAGFADGQGKWNVELAAREYLRYAATTTARKPGKPGKPGKRPYVPKTTGKRPLPPLSGTQDLDDTASPQHKQTTPTVPPALPSLPPTPVVSTVTTVHASASGGAPLQPPGHHILLADSPDPLPNLGNTCHFNVSLQALFQLPWFLTWLVPAARLPDNPDDRATLLMDINTAVTTTATSQQTQPRAVLQVLALVAIHTRARSPKVRFAIQVLFALLARHSTVFDRNFATAISQRVWKQEDAYEGLRVLEEALLEAANQAPPAGRLPTNPVSIQHFDATGNRTACTPQLLVEGAHQCKQNYLANCESEYVHQMLVSCLSTAS